MKITILAVGKCRDKAIQTLCDSYQKRLATYWPTTLVEIAERSGHIAQETGRIEKQLSKFKPGTFTTIALDERGKKHTSRSFANSLKTIENQGVQSLIFLIGGADGFAQTLKDQADLCFSLSDLTLPHMLVRPLLLEQVYRASTILQNHPYHRD